MVTLTIALVALGMSAFGLYEIIKFEEDSRVYDCDNLDVYDDLEARVNALEYGIKSNNKNIEILASRISDLELQIIDLKNQVNGLNRQMANTAESINNFTSFVDQTRGMVDENTKRLNEIQNNGRD